MADQYAGNPANYPTDFTLPDDSNPPTAAEFNVAFEALGDRTAYNHARLTKITQQDITSSTTVVVPAGATLAIFDGCGSGGGGGAGKASSAVSNANTGGGGGGGAMRSVIAVAVTPGQSLAIVIPVGGNGASVGGGSDGTATTVTRVSDSALLAMFLGGGGGAGGVENISFVNFNGVSNTPNYSFAFGGKPGGGIAMNGATMYIALLRNSSPQVGGAGSSSNAGSLRSSISDGGASPNRAGGPAGIYGATTGISFLGGGCGGGGGAGPFGSGGNGGSGSAVNESGAAANGTAGSAALDNTGAGGGGGGSAGGASSAGGLGGAGGKGGSGFLRITWIGQGA